MNGASGLSTKWYKSERERQISYDLTYMWTLNLKKWKHKKQAHRYREQIGDHQNQGMGEMGEGGENLLTSSCKVSHEDIVYMEI